MVVDRKFSQFTLENGASILGTDFFAGYRSGVDNIRFQINSLAEYFNANLNFVNEADSATLNGLVVFSDTSGKNISGLPFSPIASSLIGYLNSGDLGNIKIGANLVIDDEGFLNAEGGGGGGNVFANGSGTTTNIPVYTTDGYTIGSSSIFDDGTNVSTDEPVNAQAFRALGSADILGQGTISVSNGTTVINGSGTSFISDFSYNSTIKILGVSYSVVQVISDFLLLIGDSYTSSDDTGLSYFIDDNMFTMTSSNNENLGRFSNSGALIYDGITSITYAPSIVPQSFFGASGLAINADILNCNIDSGSAFNINVSGSAVFSVQGNGNGDFAGSLTINNDLMIGNLATSGQSIILRTNTYDTYLPRFSSSNDGSFSFLNAEADQYYFNLLAGKNFQVNGNILTNSLQSSGNVDVSGNINSNGLSQIAYKYSLTGAANDGSSDTDGVALVLGHTSNDNRQIWFMDTAKIATPNNAFQFLISSGLLGISGVATDGTGNVTSTFPLQFQNSGDLTTFGGPVTVNGQTQISGGFRNDLGNADTYYVLGNSGAYGLVMYGNNPVYDYTAIDTFFYGLPDDGYPVAFSIGGAGVQLSKYQVNTLFNTLDDGQNGTAHFGGNMGIGLAASNDYRIIADGALALNNVFDIPATNGSGGVFFVEYDVDLAVSLPFFKDSNGGVTQLGAGSGGSGTVTLVDTTTDLEVDGVPGDSFTVDGVIGLADKTGAGTGTYQLPQFDLDAKGRVSNVSNLAIFDTSNQVMLFSGAGGSIISATDIFAFGNLTLAGNTTGSSILAIGSFSAASNDTGSNLIALGGASLATNVDGNENIGIGSSTGATFTSINNAIFIGTGADGTDESINSPLAIGAGAKSGADGISFGKLAGSASTGLSDAIFIGRSADSSVNNLTNIMSIGSGASVSRSNTFSYGDGTVSHIFGGTFADSTLHIKSNATSGSLGSRGVLRLNGINDPSNLWPVTDKVTEQHAFQTTGVTLTTILSLPISNAEGGCITEAEITVNGIINNGTASGTGKIQIRGAFDGTNTYYINGVSTTTPVLITLLPGTTAPFALPLGTASAQVALSATTGPGSQNLLVQVVGSNATTITWTAWATYTTTQANIN